MRKFFAQAYQDCVKFPLYLISHPVQGYTEFKEKKKGKMGVAWFFLGLMALLTILQWQLNGFIFNMTNQTQFNSIRIIMYQISPVIILSLANWCITTLMDGKGKFKDIFLMGAYSYFPQIIGSILILIMTNFLTQTEYDFILVVSIVCSALNLYMIFTGLMVIHEYGFIKAIFTVILTLLSLAVILFVALLIFDLSEQIYGFISSLYKEIVSRYF